MARWARLELATDGLENRCSIRLSYHRNPDVEHLLRIGQNVRQASITGHAWSRGGKAGTRPNQPAGAGSKHSGSQLTKAPDPPDG